MLRCVKKGRNISRMHELHETNEYLFCFIAVTIIITYTDRVSIGFQLNLGN
jgi:hypothetical protein